MARNKKIRLTKTKVIISVVLLLIMAVALVFADKLEVLVGYKTSLASHQVTLDEINQAPYYVAYIDVGQGNSTFAELPDGKTLLIDGGDIEFGSTVAEFLQERNVETIDYMVATHADSDHIGGLNYVLENFEVVNIYRPFQISCYTDGTPIPQEDLGGIYQEIKSENLSSGRDYSKVTKTTSGVYQKFINAIYSESYTDGSTVKDSVVTVFYDGLTISGSNYEIKFYAPLLRDIKNNLAIEKDDNDNVYDDYESINLEFHSDKTLGYATFGFGNSNASASNDNSAILTLTCYGDKYFFMGDATYSEKSGKEGFSEYEFIDSLSSEEIQELSNIDVFLIGHHGSRYSTSDRLLEILTPRFVVVSVGVGNNYGHPHDESLARIANSSNLEDDYLVRTDENGDIVFANIEGEIRYFIERQGTEEKLEISFRLLIVLITVSLILFILSIRTKMPKKKRAKSF